MRSVSRLAAVATAIGGGATSSAVPIPTQHRLLQAALYGSAAASPEKRWYHSGQPSIRSVSYGVAGTMFFSVAATTLVQEARASETTKFVPKDVVLYQYEACPFCNKVRAFLDYYRIPYKIVEVNPLNKKEIKWSEYKKVPIVTVDGEHMVDSSDIIDKLFQKIQSDMPDAVLNDEEEKKWRGWVDGHLVHVLSPNIYRNTSEALESFDYITTKVFNMGGANSGGMVAMLQKVLQQQQLQQQQQQQQQHSTQGAYGSLPQNTF